MSFALPALSSDPTAPPSFADAAAAVVSFLKDHIPMGCWSISRCDGERQLHLEVRDDEYGIGAGDSVPWEATFCQYVVVGRTPQIAPDAMAIEEYRQAADANDLQIGSYVGIPIHEASGELFGTLCGFDPQQRTPDLTAHAPLLGLLSTLLASILDADLVRTEQARALEAAARDAETDAMTGLLNRRGWDRYLEQEEARYRRFGDPAAVIAVDLDGLKAVNDLQGHVAGDALIVRAAGALQDVVRTTDVVARLGGDEYGVIATRTSQVQAARLVERIRRSMADAGVEASIGLAPYAIADGFSGACAAADAAMYEEKRRRRSAAA